MHRVPDTARPLSGKQPPAALLAALLLQVVSPAGAVIDAGLQMQLGNPSGATADTNNYGHYLIERPVQAIDYNATLGQPNWVSWSFSAADTNNAVARSTIYFTDTNLPPNFYRVTSGDYTDSGWARGHMCPSADRLNSRTNNDMVFLMSNIIPQALNQNSGVWAQLENECRVLAGATNELLIICGPGGFGTNRLATCTNVAIPAYTWKIAVVVPGGTVSALERIDYFTRVIAVNIPNSNSVASTPWTNFVTSVEQLQAETGFTFFTALPPNLAAVLRSKIDGMAPPPAGITAFAPTSGNEGIPISISGTNLGFTTNVLFNSSIASFTIHSTSNLTAIVPAGAASGPITVEGLGGTHTSDASFIVGTNGAPDLMVTLTHAGDFTQGDSGDDYTIVVANGGTATSSGTITVSNALPAGLTATYFGGGGWSADLGTLTCTREDGLLPGAAYPPITLTVDVAASAPASVTNVAVVWGGGDTNISNNTASDPTTINPALAPAATTLAATAVDTTTATLNGTINPNGQPASAWFEYGPTPSYGSAVSLPGALGGMVPLAVSTTVTGLQAGATYYFRVVATNVLGSAMGLDQSYTTGVPDLAARVTHSGGFIQGCICSYAITITNIGSGSSLGPVIVTNLLPAGLSACGIAGNGWATDLGTLTCTRSDTLAVGAAYPPIILSVNVASNAPASVTTTTAVSGGGETNVANNLISDETIVLPLGAGGGLTTLLGWDMSALTGGTTNFGPSPMPPTTNAASLASVGLTRGSGVGTNGQAAARAWGGNTWTNTSLAAAIASNKFATFSVAASNGYTVSLGLLSRFDYRHSPAGPTNGLLQCQVGSGEFIDLVALTYPSANSSGASLNPIILPAIPALQRVGPGTNVTFRIVNWGGTDPAGTWYIFDKAGSAAPDLVVQGTVAPIVPAVADLALVLTHAGSFTQGDLGRTYTITVTNGGVVATTGPVSVTNDLPAGLMATALEGSGWSADLGALTCTRSDALPAGGAYPPITLTVNVLTNAPASVTNWAAVAGGGDLSTGNNAASDPTTIIALAPIELWRLYWFGTTADSGPAADTAVNTSDGLANLLKYGLGLNPLVATNDPVAGDITTGYLRLTAPRDPQATDVSFHVEITSALAALWTTNGTIVEVNSPTLLRVRADAPVAASESGFIRLRVSRP